MVFALIAAVISTVAFSLIALLYKDLRNKNVPTLGVMAIAGLCVPVWIILGLWLVKTGDANSSSAYWLSLGMWAAVVYVWNASSKYLYRYKGLTELHSYSLGGGLVLGVLADMAYFQQAFDAKIMFSAGLLLLGGILLAKKRHESRDIPWTHVAALVAVTSVFAVVAATTYKIGVHLQPNVLSQVVFTQSILYSLFFLTGAQSFVRNIRKARITLKHVLGICGLLLVATVFEAYAVKAFPVTMLVMLSVIPLALFSFYDAKNKELACSKKSIAALCLILAGLLLPQL